MWEMLVVVSCLSKILILLNQQTFAVTARVVISCISESLILLIFIESACVEGTKSIYSCDVLELIKEHSNEVISLV